jgi:DNA-binding response OmpR family regulator
MISSMIEEDKVIQALEAGAWDYIVKPFSSRIVLAKIRRALRDLP